MPARISRGSRRRASPGRAAEPGHAVTSGPRGGCRTRADEMFDLVADVERYPEFLPLCEALRVRRHVRAGRASRSLIADMTRRLQGDPRDASPAASRSTGRTCAILVEYLDGPFSHLENRWTFRAEPAAAATSTFSSTTSSRAARSALLMGTMFDRAFRQFADAFEKRADVVYGRPPALGLTVISASGACSGKLQRLGDCSIAPAPPPRPRSP